MEFVTELNLPRLGTCINFTEVNFPKLTFPEVDIDHEYLQTTALVVSKNLLFFVAIYIAIYVALSIVEYTYKCVRNNISDHITMRLKQEVVSIKAQISLLELVSIKESLNALLQQNHQMKYEIMAMNEELTKARQISESFAPQEEMLESSSPETNTPLLSEEGPSIPLGRSSIPQEEESSDSCDEESLSDGEAYYMDKSTRSQFGDPSCSYTCCYTTKNLKAGNTCAHTAVYLHWHDEGIFDVYCQQHFTFLSKISYFNKFYKKRDNKTFPEEWITEFNRDDNE